mmetsp:Transcript_56438/g.100398  ORF Transcript_56438/g.100398 Transcript_56438/m.100398 type:complete len:1593 (+) Transcript_56438:78-4856(+)|eukprot:CAMPEP_0197644382 /NCGR_PEP_ID=MMETSP1338-20131121/17373_1 /TAXON_ID=43686 ORGANISM="Pelagodinium beii, Strain RCC1491" /NCGR_SAMPLE_ID=MMETSP1338 /ASSEMBLY_ACC=CAM_ASM_000754 /LENGTH=1592 /DNA_ID=CAMNT_0043217773 /DNA_START=18 /DNA_END=4796 /DNA_ORIENTATION=+
MVVGETAPIFSRTGRVTHAEGLHRPTMAVAAPELLRPKAERSRGAVAVGLGLCTMLTQTSRRKSRMARHEASGNMMTSKLEQIATTNPFLERFLQNNVNVMQQYLAMVPATADDFDSKNLGDYSTELHDLANKGRVKGMNVSHFSDGKKETYAMVSVNTDIGMVCGYGQAKAKTKKDYDKARKEAKHCACAQALMRLENLDDPAEMLSQAKEAGHESAEQVEESIEAFSEFIERVSLKIIQPFGGTYKAMLQASFKGRVIQGRSVDCDTKEEAVAGAGDAMLRSLRSAIGVRPDATFAPDVWAENLKDNEMSEVLDLEWFGDAEDQATLHKLLCKAKDQKAIQKALEAARVRQDKRLRLLEEMSAAPDDEHGLPTGNQVARRCYEVTKIEDEEWRREEVKGKLPAEKIRKEISEALELHQSVIVSGGTGSGKSTQLPQFILDDFTEWKAEGDVPEQELSLEVGDTVEISYAEEGDELEWFACEILEVNEDKTEIGVRYHDGDEEEYEVDVKERVRAAPPTWMRQKPRILVTQPRRIAAVTLAERVAWERNSEPGGEIGYSIRGDTIRSDSDTGTIDFMTVGVVLKKLISNPLLIGVNVVILDEVHERDLMTDFALILLKEVLQNRNDIRLVLMSATLDVQTFVNYLPGAAVVEVPSGTRFPVEEIHLEDDFFASMNGTSILLREEQKNRQQEGLDTSRAEHDFALASEDEVRQKVASLIETDEELWTSHSEKFCEGRAPDDVDADDLRFFLTKIGDSSESNEEAANEQITLDMLEEQVSEMTSYSDDMKQAWEAFSEDKDDLSNEDYLTFLEQQNIKPFQGGRASWDMISSIPWWGGEDPYRSSRGVLDVASETIQSVYQELLDEPEDVEIGTGSILVFLPGWSEIQEMARRLEKCVHSDKLWVVKVHSSVPKDEQSQAFERPDYGMVKVILSTNIAESSVTIDDARIVVDTGLIREMTYDPKERLSSMSTVWVCQSNAVQRKGRAGRVRSGKVYRLYSREQFKAVPWRPAPEMQRCNLSSTCLQTISLGHDPREFLALAPDPPQVQAVEAAMAELTAIDAITDGSPPTLNPLGQMISRFPLEPMFGRAMVLGTIFGIPETTAALILLGAEGVFSRSIDHKEDVLKKKKSFCTYSDSLASLRAFIEFEKIYRERGWATAERWCEHFFVNYQRCCSLSKRKFQLLTDVQRSGLLDAAALDGLNPDEWYAENWDESDEYGTPEVEEGEEEEGEDEEEEEVSEDDIENFKESTGAIFEADESATSMSDQEWITEVHRDNEEVENEALLVGIFTSTNPQNLAFLPTADTTKDFHTASAKVMCTNKSVNFDQTLDEPSWFSFNDMRAMNGKMVIAGMTQLKPWQMAVFGGLRSRTEPDWVLDGWVTLNGDKETMEVAQAVRRELYDAITWLSVAAFNDKVATGMVARGQALFTIIGQIFTNQEVDEESLDFLKSWKLYELQKDEDVIAAPGEDRDEVFEFLKKKKKVELQVMLRELKLPVSGNKNPLIQRLCEHWFPPPELDGEPFEGAVGDAVSAVCPDDDEWYAGVIESIGKDGTFVVAWDDPDGGPESHEVVATRIQAADEDGEAEEEEEEDEE